jgi:hypothetical protein
LKPDDRVITRKTLLAIAEILQQGRDSCLCGKLTNKAEISTNRSHRQVPSTRSIASIQAGLGIHRITPHQLVPSAEQASRERRTDPQQLTKSPVGKDARKDSPFARSPRQMIGGSPRIDTIATDNHNVDLVE